MPYTAMQLAEAFLKTGELDDALEALNQQLQEQANDDDARRLRIQILMRRDNLNTALSDLEAIQNKTANDYLSQSIILERGDNVSAAITAIQEARHLDENSERLIERYLYLLIKAKDYQSALELIQQQERTWQWLEREGDVFVLLGDDVLATARYGLVLSQLSDFENSMSKEYLQALKLRVILARANAYHRLEQLDTAEEHYLAAQNILPDDASISFNLGLLAFLRGNETQALEQCKIALSQLSSTMHDNMLNAIKEDERYQTFIKKLIQ